MVMTGAAQGLHQQLVGSEVLIQHLMNITQK